MFGAIFFVSIGALMDITKIPALIIPALMLIVVSIGAKFLTVYLSSRSQGYDTQTSLKTAFGLSSSGGELALVVAKGGADVGTTSSIVLPMVGTMTIITTFITPYLIKIGWKLVDIRQGSDGKFSFGLKRSKK
jgi:CPA2 family monovalent cation:H+ antiporter-2